MSAERGVDCAVIENSIKIADKKGWDSSLIFCPLVHCCDGKTCMFSNEAPVVPTEKIAVVSGSERFERRLIKTVDKLNA